MKTIQSPQNRFTEGYFNVNILKGVAAGVIYIIIEAILGFLWILIFDNCIASLIYTIILIVVSVLLLSNWLKMWRHLPQYYEKHFTKLYETKLQIKLEDLQKGSDSSEKQMDDCKQV